MPHRFTSDPEEVSARMRRIHGKNTQPELALFEILDFSELPYLRHPRVQGVSVDAQVESSILVFVDSPFWHLRDSAELNRLSLYWQRRLIANRRRDRRQTRMLRASGYTVVRVWADQVQSDYVLRRMRRARQVAARRRTD